MNRKKISIDLSLFSAEIEYFIGNSDIYDSSCSKEANVYFIDKDSGYFLKIAKSGLLKSESLMHSYFHKLGLTSSVCMYKNIGDKDYLITERVIGEDCVYKEYLNQPKKLCETIAYNLRLLHEKSITDCPIQNNTYMYVQTALDGYDNGIYNSDLFNGLWDFPSIQEAWQAATEGMKNLEKNVLIHGDYCLPNILLNNWKFSGFIDLNNGGVGDRHIDILWGIWTLKYNLKTTQYTEQFINAYGSDMINQDKLRCFAAIEMFR